MLRLKAHPAMRCNAIALRNQAQTPTATQPKTHRRSRGSQTRPRAPGAQADPRSRGTVAQSRRAPSSPGRHRRAAPRGYLVGDVGPHLPGVPAVPQQQRLVLVAVEQLERLPHLRAKRGEVSGELEHPGPGRTSPDLPPPAPSRSPDSPPPARPGAAAARGAACRPSIAHLHPPPARPHVPAWAPPFCHAAPPAPPRSRPSRRGHPRWRWGAPSIWLRPDPLPECLGRRAGRRVLEAGRGSGGAPGAAVSRRSGTAVAPSGVLPGGGGGGAAMAQNLKDLAGRLPTGPRGVGTALKLLLGAGALAYGVRESVFIGEWSPPHNPSEPSLPPPALTKPPLSLQWRAASAPSSSTASAACSRTPSWPRGCTSGRARPPGPLPGPAGPSPLTWPPLPQDPLVPVSHHLRHPSAATKNLLPHRFQR